MGGADEEVAFEEDEEEEDWLKALKTADWEARALVMVERDSRRIETSLPVMMIGWMDILGDVRAIIRRRSRVEAPELLEMSSGRARV